MAFQKGNVFGRGRPKISLQKPELLLPAVFGKAGVNWQKDFVLLYRALRDRANKPFHLDLELSDLEFKKLPETAQFAINQEKQRRKDEKKLMDFFIQFMPYLCTKVQLKEIDGKMASTPGDSASMAKATSKLLQALEAEQGTIAPKPETGGHP